jgi:hypothetical protein
MVMKAVAIMVMMTTNLPPLPQKLEDVLNTRVALLWRTPPAVKQNSNTKFLLEAVGQIWKEVKCLLNPSRLEKQPEDPNEPPARVSLPRLMTENTARPLRGEPRKQARVAWRGKGVGLGVLRTVWQVPPRANVHLRIHRHRTVIAIEKEIVNENEKEGDSHLPRKFPRNIIYHLLPGVPIRQSASKMTIDDPIGIVDHLPAGPL